MAHSIDPVQSASTFSSISNLCKTIVGAGVLAMPFAFRADGVLFGILIILLAGLTSSFGLYLQLRSSKFLPDGHATFFGVCSITYPKLSVLFDFSIFLQCFGCCVSYLVIVGDLLPDLVHSSKFNRTEAIIGSAIIIVPLIYLKNLDSLKYSSVVGLAAIGYMCLLVVAHFVFGDVDDSLKGEISWIKPSGASSMLSTFSIIVFAYTGHQNMFSIINESKDKSFKNIMTVITVSLSISTALFLVVGLAGYFTFGSSVLGNVILMYDDKLPNVLGRYATIFMVIVSFPLMFHPCRLSANNIVYFVERSLANSKLSDEQAEDTEQTSLINNNLKPVIVPLSKITFLVLTTLLAFLAYGIALSVSEFALVLSLVGATGSTTISFILPGLFGYKLLGNDPTLNSHRLDLFFKRCSLALTIWGVLVMVICVTVTLSM